MDSPQNTATQQVEFDYKPKHEGLGRGEDDVQDQLLDDAAQRRYGSPPTSLHLSMFKEEIPLLSVEENLPHPFSSRAYRESCDVYISKPESYPDFVRYKEANPGERYKLAMDVFDKARTLDKVEVDFETDDGVDHYAGVISALGLASFPTALAMGRLAKALRRRPNLLEQTDADDSSLASFHTHVTTVSDEDVDPLVVPALAGYKVKSRSLSSVAPGESAQTSEIKRLKQEVESWRMRYELLQKQFDEMERRVLAENSARSKSEKKLRAMITAKPTQSHRVDANVAGGSKTVERSPMQIKVAKGPNKFLKLFR
jgi:hypothetical protein